MKNKLMLPLTHEDYEFILKNEKKLSIIEHTASALNG